MSQSCQSSEPLAQRNSGADESLLARPHGDGEHEVVRRHIEHEERTFASADDLSAQLDQQAKHGRFRADSGHGKMGMEHALVVHDTTVLGRFRSCGFLCLSG